MLRRVAIATFAVAVSLVVACGHQVTPNPTNNNLSGDVVVKFAVNGTLDFTDYTYAIVIDTCGNGTPYPQAYNTTFDSYSYGFFIGGTFGQTLPQLVEYFVIPNSNNSIQSVNVPESSSLEQFVPNYSGQGNEFELVFNRAELNNPLNQSQPCPNLPAVAVSPSPSASAGASPTASPTAVASGASPVASSSPTPAVNPTTSAQQYWYFNFFTIQNKVIVDSLGIGGATDTTFNGVGMNTNITQDYPIFKATGGSEPSNPAAALSGGDIQNYQ